MSSYWYYLKGLFHDYVKHNDVKALHYYKKYNGQNKDINKKIANQLIKDKKYHEAIPYLKNILHHKENDIEILKMLCTCYKKTSMLGEAESVYRDLEKQGTRIDYYDYASILYKNGKKSEAIGNYSKAIKQDIGDIKSIQGYLECKNEFDSWVRLGRNRIKGGASFQAISAFRKALEIIPNDGKLWEDFANCCKEQGKDEEAIDAYNKTLSYGNIKGDIYYNLGNLYEKTGNSEKAENNFKIACRIFDVNPRYGSARLHDKKAVWDKSVEAYYKYLENNTYRPPVLYSRFGRALDYCYRWEEAKNALEQLEINDNTELDSVFRLSTLYIRLEQYDKAIDLLRKQEECLFVVAGLSFCYAKKGMYREAVKIYFDNELLVIQECYKNKNLEAYFKFSKKNINTIYANARKILNNDSFSSYKLFLIINSLILLMPYKGSLPDLGKNKRLLRNQIYITLSNHCPLKANYILYESFLGNTISCNPYAIFRYLFNKEEFKNYVHIWVINDDEMIPPFMRNHKNIFFINRGSVEYLEYLSTAKYLINNVTFPDYFIKRKGQVYCNTWHGTPLKSLGDANKFDLYGYGNVTRNFLQADWLIHSNKFTEDVLLDKYHVRHIFNGQSVVTGYPRQDLLIKITDDERLKIRKLIVGDDARPILLYAPTWRDYLSPEEQKIKFLNILGAFDDKKYNVIFKGHQFLEKALRNSGFPSVPKWIDTNELLSVVDVLITDYSSIGIDFLVENKPVFYLVEDFDEYNEKRGVIVNPEDFPGIVVGTLEDLNNKLEELKIESISVINDSYNYIEKDDGNASLRVTNLIFNSKPNPIIYDKPNFLFYPGVLLKNGIGSSFVNLVNSISDEVNVYVITDASHLRRVENKVNMNHILNKIHIIPRVGGFVNSIEDAWIYSKWYASKKSLSTKFDERLKDTFKREWSRIFGDARFSIAINFEGYNRNMTGVFSIYKDNLIVLHNDMLGEYKEKFNYLSMIFELYKNYNKIASVSEATNLLNCKNLSSDYSVRKDNFVCIDNVIDINHILKLSNAPLVADGFFIGKPVFITIGRLSPEKDHQKLIMAFSKVVIKYPDAELLILGDGFLKDELIDLVNYLNLGNSVHFVGIVENPYPWLRRADCFVLSSNHEGQPMVLLEALALNKPIISTDITATHNLLIDTGSLLVNNDVDSLAAGMIDFCKKPFKPANKDLVSYNLNCKKIFFDICNF